MKQKFLLLCFLLISFGMYAQFPLDHTFTDQTIYEVSYVNLENSGKKLYTTNLDGETYQLKFYNIDYSPYKTITVDLSSIFYVNYKEFYFDVFYIAENLFDTDSEIEMLAELYYIENTENEYEYSQVLAFDENGTVMFETDIAHNNSWILWPSMNGSEVNGYGQPGSIHNTANGTKMIIGLYDFVDSIYKFEVYNLPGTLSTSTLKGITAAEDAMQLKAYPNPAKSQFTVDYKLVEGENEADLLIYDSNGRLIKKFKVDNQEGKISVSAEDMPAGFYLYEINTRKKGYTRRKLVITK